MAGNVTAFNTVWTFDLYQTYVRRRASDRHYLWMGRVATIAAVVLSVATAYLTARFNDVMDVLQLVFAFVNAPLFATFLLGMFWRRTTGHGAFTGLVAGTLAAAAHHGLTSSRGAATTLEGAWLAGPFHVYPSEMAQNFWTAIVAWITCFVATLAVSLVTRETHTDEELRGLVSSLTPRERRRGALAGRSAHARRRGGRPRRRAERRLRVMPDVRFPIGLLLLSIGALLVAYGIGADAAVVRLGVNVDLWWGIVLVVAGAAIVGATGRRKRGKGAATPRPPCYIASMASAHDLERLRTALMGHCYRMMGSAADADDAVQETMIRAWRGLGRFEERASLRTWLTRIATRVCLDALADRGRRLRPTQLEGPGTVDDELTELPRGTWIEPIPDDVALPSDADPAERVALRQTIRLAFVAALQELPPRQRAALLLTDVLGWSAAEVAETLDTSVASVNSALQRARAKLDALGEPPAGAASLPAAQSALLDRYVDAFERYDVDALVRLLHDDATLSMPPYRLWLRGHESIARWLLGRGIECRGSRLVPVRASGAPAFGQYRTTGPWAIVVLDVRDDRIAAVESFLDVATLFPRFGLAPNPPS
jgi:RNA polymerase sigma-70 factor (ECF subfamily)